MYEDESRRISKKAQQVVVSTATTALEAMLTLAGLSPIVGPAEFGDTIAVEYDYVWYADDDPVWEPVRDVANVWFILQFPEDPEVRAHVRVLWVGEDETHGYWVPAVIILSRNYKIGPEEHHESSTKVLSSPEGWLFYSFGPALCMSHHSGSEEWYRDDLLAMSPEKRRDMLRIGLARGLYMWSDWFNPPLK